jgi:SAM-dependent methyltransferase
MSDLRARCPICRAGLRTRSPAWVLECPDCRFLGSTLTPDFSDAGKDATLDEARRSTALRSLREENYAVILGLIAREAGAGAKRLLDVGCAHGWFAEMAAARGFEVVGIEPDAEMAALARRQGIDVRRGLFPDILGPHDRFDVIVFNDVFEHLPDVVAATRACHARLAPGGLLVINLPSARGFIYRVANALQRAGIPGPFERMWQKNFPSPHLSYFTPEHLARLVRQHGFGEVASARLKSVSTSGLWSRLRYDRTAGPLRAAAVWAATVALMPLLGILPADINVQVFRAG